MLPLNSPANSKDVLIIADIQSSQICIVQRIFAVSWSAEVYLSDEREFELYVGIILLKPQAWMNLWLSIVLVMVDNSEGDAI